MATLLETVKTQAKPQAKPKAKKFPTLLRKSQRRVNLYKIMQIMGDYYEELSAFQYVPAPSFCDDVRFTFTNGFSKRDFTLESSYMRSTFDMKAACELQVALSDSSQDLFEALRCFQASKRGENLEKSQDNLKSWEDRTMKKLFEGKKFQDDEMNKSTRFNNLGFSSVEVDTQKYLGQEFKRDVFSQLENAWEKVFNQLPQAEEKPSLHFRKLGRYRSAGLYSPKYNAIAVDVRDTTSLVHEYGHYIDYKLKCAKLSSRNEFYPLYKECRTYLFQNYRDEKVDYFAKRTEVFARAFEVWAKHTLKGDIDMLVSYDVNGLQYKYLEDNKEIVIKTMNALMGLD